MTIGLASVERDEEAVCLRLGEGTAFRLPKWTTCADRLLAPAIGSDHPR